MRGVREERPLITSSERAKGGETSASDVAESHQNQAGMRCQHYDVPRRQQEVAHQRVCSFVSVTNS